MKLASINNSIPTRAYNNSKTKNNNPSFRGVTEGLIKFWQFVDNHGRAMQFTVEDMTGTNIPRSWKGLVAGKKYTGHYNLPAFFQEAIREFLTGPTMCLVPWISISLAKKVGGESANIENKNMRNLSYLLEEKTTVEEGVPLADSFYKTVVKDMLDCSTGKDVDEETVNGMVGLFKKLADNSNKKPDETITKKQIKKEKGEILGEIQKTFETTVKDLKDGYAIKDAKGNCDYTNFLTAKYTTEAIDEVTGQHKIGANGVKEYSDYTIAYIKDYTKKFGEVINKEYIDNFKHSKQTYRLVTAVGFMMFLTGFLMCQIPKLYTKASGLINPNARAVYDEADKTKPKKTEAKK